MKKNYYLIAVLLVSAIIFSLKANAQVFDLSSTKNFSKQLKLGSPSVYKPSKLIIGTSTKFIIKAEPNTHVSLVTSDENQGAAFINGNRLRLGEINNPHESITNNNGVAEISITLPLEKELIGRIMYFEALIWKNPDHSDIEVAKVMGIDGREAANNAVIITAPAKNVSGPGITPGISGLGDLNQTMHIMNQINKDQKNDDSENYDNEMNYYNEPLMLRNLRLPQTKTEK